MNDRRTCRGTGKHIRENKNKTGDGQKDTQTSIQENAGMHIVTQRHRDAVKYVTNVSQRQTLLFPLH